MIARAARQLPPQMPSPPSYQKVNPGDQPVIFLSLRSATLPLSTVNEYAETIAQRLSMVSGVAQVQLFGAAKYAVRVDVDPRQLSVRGIGIDEVAAAIQSAQRQPADRHDVRTRSLVHGAGQRAADAGAGVRAPRHLLSERQSGAAQRGRTRLRRHRAGQAGELLPRPAQHQPRRSRSSPARTSLRSSTPSRRCCRRSASNCRRRCCSTCAPTAPARSASRCTTSR